MKMFLSDIKYGQFFKIVSNNLRQPTDPLHWETVKLYKKIKKGYKGVICQLIDCECSNPKFAHLFTGEIGTLIKLPLYTKISPTPYI
jgi:hypothetical protein